MVYMSKYKTTDKYQVHGQMSSRPVSTPLSDFVTPRAWPMGDLPLWLRCDLFITIIQEWNLILPTMTFCFLNFHVCSRVTSQFNVTGRFPQQSLLSLLLLWWLLYSPIITATIVCWGDVGRRQNVNIFGTCQPLHWRAMWHLHLMQPQDLHIDSTSWHSDRRITALNTGTDSFW